MPQLRDFLNLMKPSIMLLVLLTGAAALMLEGSLHASNWQFWAILFGLMLTGGCANGLNQYFERDIDAQMGRTKNRRPLAMKKNGAAPRPLFYRHLWNLGGAAVRLFV
jgi:protoheme IX farnesyltransferase